MDDLKIQCAKTKIDLSNLQEYKSFTRFLFIQYW